MMLPSLFLLLTSLVAVAIGQWIYQRYKQQQIFKIMGIPYVPPNLIDGSFGALRAKGTNQIEVTSQWVKKYGKVFGYFVGFRATLSITDLDMIKQILIKDFHAFSNRPDISIEVEPVMSTLVGLKDQRWKDVRSLLAPTFSMAKMKLLAGIMNKKIDLLLEIINEDYKKGETTEWYGTYQGLTLDTICECALAMESKCQTDKNDSLLFAVRAFLQNAINPFVLMALYFPVFASLLSHFANKLAYSGRMTQRIVNHLRQVMKVRRSTANIKTVDVLQLMMDASETINEEDGSKKPSKKTLSDSEIIANAWVFLLGGFETTANAMTFTTFLLSKYPDVQEKLFQEIVSVFPDKSQSIPYDRVNELPYLDQVLSESLRLYPPVVSFISRQAAKDVKVGNILIPKDMAVSIPIWEIHRDPKYWPNPDVFDPERFSPSAKSEANRHPMSYLPFGAGPRNCIGMRFGQLEAKLGLARVIRNFKLEMTPQTEDPPILTVPTVAINPANGVYIKAVPRPT